jgi:hypothetical protein
LEKAAQIEWVREADMRDAFVVFQKFSDKDWSFTDCVSKVVMERLGVKKALHSTITSGSSDCRGCSVRGDPTARGAFTPHDRMPR